jgi:F-type H+-transporting ATPase subunit delta
MKQSRETKKYAQAVFIVADETDQLTDTIQRMDILLNIYTSSPEFRLFLQSRRISPAEKMKILKKVFMDILSDLELELPNHLLEEGHIQLLVAVIKKFGFITQSVKTSLKVSISTAEQMNPEELSDIVRNIEQKLGKKVDAEALVDPEILGGVKFRIGNTIVDGSIATRLQKLENSLYQG